MDTRHTECRAHREYIDAFIPTAAHARLKDGFLPLRLVVDLHDLALLLRFQLGDLLGFRGGDGLGLEDFRHGVLLDVKDTSECAHRCSREGRDMFESFTILRGTLRPNGRRV